MKPKVVACGVGGLLGAPLIAALAERYELVRLVRPGASRESGGSVRRVAWDPALAPAEWAGELEGAVAVINLSGEAIAARRWTADQKKLVRDSRVFTTRSIVEAIRRAKRKPSTLLNASAVGFYGPQDDRWLDESAPSGPDFLSRTCAEWEAEAMNAAPAGVRVVALRTGIVLSRRGGALVKMLAPFRWGLGGPLGSGRQWMSWIHESDEIAAILACLENPALSGPVNLTAPEPVTMRQFAQTLGRVLRRPARMPVPAFALKALLGEMAEMLLTGQRVRPNKLLAAGHHFRYPTLDSALKQLLR